ncbi:hypothetical protein FOA43_003766 [Brettanomyces nanus]|uniref:Uncharacterized protein n=1 Tax=Eeniella nana TaxID=13502 RepID=A0A875S602_EENNA|nr:uncharacterized protein FOA43_003766 [Brettanomyces nanus]QPG76378.1 hypothetical protein FOA43_003766 [Brettanomyces nanus]
MNPTPNIASMLKQHATSFGLATSMIGPVLVTKYTMASNQPWLFSENAEGSNDGITMMQPATMIPPRLNAKDLDDMSEKAMLIIYD